MMTSFMVRLVSADLDRGVFAGEVQHVATGARSIVRTSAELLAVLQELGGVGTADVSAPAHGSSTVIDEGRGW